jgi:hypothetical protein
MKRLGRFKDNLDIAIIIQRNKKKTKRTISEPIEFFENVEN